MKTCATCKWYENATCFFSSPSWSQHPDNEYISIRESSRCSRWETKLDRRCNNCEFFDPGENVKGECRLSPPNHTGSFPTVLMLDWCGEFRGKE
jgi:hypothetical protein